MCVDVVRSAVIDSGYQLQSDSDVAQIVLLIGAEKCATTLL